MSATQRAGSDTEPMRHIRLLATLTAGVALTAPAVTPSFAAARYPLGAANQAHIDIESRRTSGKLLLDPSR